MPPVQRPPIDAGRVRAALVAPAGAWAGIDIVAETASTNADLVARAGTLAAPWALVAEHQSAGRGRAGRSWQSPPRAGLAVSALLRPPVPVEYLGWLPLLTGLAVVRVLRAVGAPAALKWPNDVLLPADAAIDGLGPWRKVAGILAHAAGGDVVVGIGLNVSQAADELPVPTATSLAASGWPATDRSALLAALLTELAAVVERWTGDDGDAQAPGPPGAPSLADEYAAASATLGLLVRAELAGGAGTVEGVAERIAADGSLVVARADGSRRIVAAGDVHHLFV